MLCLNKDMLIIGGKFEKIFSPNVSWVAPSNPQVNIVLWVVFGFLVCEMCHWCWYLGTCTTVDDSSCLGEVVELEATNTVPNEKTDDLGDKVESCDGQGVGREGA